MKTGMAILTILILLSFSALAQAGVVVDKTNIDIVAGDDIILVYTLSGSSSLCHVSVNITPDPVGFNLMYNPVVVVPGVLYLYLNTSMTLSPGSYVLTIVFESEQGESPYIIKKVHHTHIVPPVVVDNETDPVIPPDEENETVIPIILPPEQESCDYIWFYILLIVIGVSVLLFFVVRKYKKK